MAKRALVLAIVVGLTGPATAAVPTLQRLVLAIGANDGGPRRATLRYANTDARALARVMVDLGGVSPGDAVVVENATRRTFEVAMKQLAERVRIAKTTGKRVEVLVYYSGHSDEEGLLLGRAKIPYRRVRKAVEALPADVRLAVVDSCAAGALTRTKGGKRRPPFLIDTSTTVSGHAFLTSSSEDEVAQESDRIGGSFFTHYLISGLRGAADVSRDGKVTLNEVYRYAYDETLARTERTRSGPQHAAYDIQLAGTGDLVLTDVRATSARLALAPALSGRFFVRDDKGRLVAELRKSARRSTELGLSPGRYVVTAHLREGVYGARVVLARGSKTRLKRSDMSKVALERTVARGSHPHEIVIEEVEVIGPMEGDEDPNVPFNLALVPGLSINGDRERVTNGFALNLVAGYGDRLRGAEFALGANLRGSEASGLQLALGANVVHGRLRGLQVSAGYNQANGLHGAQLSTVNYAEAGRGAQFGLVNIGGYLSGVQIGLVNIGTDVKGAQIGLVNYAEGSDVPIGALNIITGGLNHFSVTTSDLNLVNANLRLGGRYFYNLLSAGFHPVKRKGEPMPWSFGLGVGVHVPLSERVFLAFDFGAHKVQVTKRFDDLHLLSRVRAQVGFRIAPRFAVVGGLTANVLASFDGHTTFRDGEGVLGYGLQTQLSEKEDVFGTEVSAWPGFFVGVEI